MTLPMYRETIKSNRATTEKKLAENEQCYNSLKNKDSEFARQVLALQKLHRRAFEIYRDAPDDL